MRRVINGSPCVRIGTALGGLLAVGGPASAESRPLGPEPHPYTTERGRFQFEFSPLSYALDRRNPEGERRRVDTFDVPYILKYGLTDDLDIQIGGELFIFERDRDRDAGVTERSRGFGDLSLRSKYNLWGNDESETALSVMPFAVLPTGSSEVRGRGVRGGVMLPGLWEPVDGFWIEFTPSFAGVRNSDDDGYVFEFAQLLALNVEIGEGLDSFIEFESSVTSESGDPWVGLVGTGLTVEITENLLVEPAIHFGVTRSADDVAISLTLAVRF